MCCTDAHLCLEGWGRGDAPEDEGSSASFCGWGGDRRREAAAALTVRPQPPPLSSPPLTQGRGGLREPHFRRVWVLFVIRLMEAIQLLRWQRAVRVPGAK